MRHLNQQPLGDNATTTDRCLQISVASCRRI